MQRGARMPSRRQDEVAQGRKSRIHLIDPFLQLIHVIRFKGCLGWEKLPVARSGGKSGRRKDG